MSFDPSALPNLHAETQALHAGQKPDPTTNARAVPIYATTSYVFDDAAHAARLFGLQEFGNIYTRIMNPTNDVFEQRVAALEGGVAALAVASGQAAETLSILNLAGAGDNIVSSTSLYGGTYNLFHYTLPKLGITVKFVDGLEARDLRAGDRRAHQGRLPRDDRQPAARRPRHPRDRRRRPRQGRAGHRRQHLRPAAGEAHRARRRHRRPLGHQVDRRPRHGDRRHRRRQRQLRLGGIGPLPRVHRPGSVSYHGVVYSEAFGNLAFILKLRVQWLRDVGAALSPFNAFLFLQGLETLPLRIERHSQNALAVARWLEDRPEVEWVSYPGLKSHPTHETAARYLKGGYGGVVTFGVKGGAEAGRRLIDSVKIFTHLANVGDAKSLIIHPASTTHQQLTAEEQAATGTTEDLVRLSVGIEHVDDLIADLDQALRAATDPSAPRELVTA